MKKMLHSFDGGGVLGVGPATFLKLAEYYMGFSWKKPDAVAGTSVGSIIAACAALGMCYHEIEREFYRSVGDIFQEAPLAWRIDPSTPRYDGKGLEKALRDVFGSTRMSDLDIPCFIVAMDYNKGKPKIYDSYDGDLIWEVVASSCSAPTYFPPIHGIVDGGLIANNPSMCLITGLVQKHQWDLKDMWLLSIGTNGDYWENPNVDSRTGKLEWAKILLGSPTRGNEEIATFQSRALLGCRELRIEPILSKNYGLDDQEIIGEYSDLWRGLYGLRREEVKEWLDRFQGSD